MQQALNLYISLLCMLLYSRNFCLANWPNVRSDGPKTIFTKPGGGESFGSKGTGLLSPTVPSSMKSILNTTTKGPAAAPANLLFLGYQHNYYNYDEPLIPSVKVRPLIGQSFLSETLADLKVVSSFKTAKSAASHRKPHLSFAGFGNYPSLPATSNALDQMDMAASENRDTVRLFHPDRNDSENAKSDVKFDSIYGISTGSSYTPACVKSQLQTICLDDPFYPTDSVKEAVSQSQQSFPKLYAEVAFQSADNLCDGLARVDEEKYCSVFSQIHPISSAQDGSSTAGFDGLRARPTVASTSARSAGSLPTPSPNQRLSAQGKGYICQSVIHYARVLRAKNHRGQWRIVVNVPGYTQTSRFEECTRPLQRCQYISSKLQSSCIQKWNFHRLMVWDKYNGFEMDIFRLPVTCSCFIRPKAPYVPKSIDKSTSSPIHNAGQATVQTAAPRPPPMQEAFQHIANDWPAIQTSETSKRYSYMPPDGPPVDPYLYYHYLTNLLPIQSVRYLSPGTVQLETTDYGMDWRLRRNR